MIVTWQDPWRLIVIMSRPRTYQCALKWSESKKQKTLTLFYKRKAKLPNDVFSLCLMHILEFLK